MFRIINKEPNDFTINSRKNRTHKENTISKRNLNIDEPANYNNQNKIVIIID